MKQAINNYDRVRYFRAMGINLMNEIETHTNKIMSEINPQLEDRFWACCDSNHLPGIRKAHRDLCELHDSITMDEEQNE